MKKKQPAWREALEAEAERQEDEPLSVRERFIKAGEWMRDYMIRENGRKGGKSRGKLAPEKLTEIAMKGVAARAAKRK